MKNTQLYKKNIIMLKDNLKNIKRSSNKKRKMQGEKINWIYIRQINNQEQTDKKIRPFVQNKDSLVKIKRIIFLKQPNGSQILHLTIRTYKN